VNVLELLDGLKERGLLDRVTTVCAGDTSVTLAGPQADEKPLTDTQLKKLEEAEQALRDELQYGSADV
jgi:hypothetical protein